LLCIIAKVDESINVPHDSITIDSVAGDPLGQAKFRVIDSGASLPLQVQQEVIFIDETIALTPSGAGSQPFTDNLASNDIGNYTSTNNPSGGSPATWTITPADTNHALLLFPANAASATIGTADQIYAISGSPTTVNTLTTCNGSTGWGEIPAQGSAAAWPALGAIGAPSGKGFFLDATTLEGKTISGNWSGNLRLSDNGGAGSVTVTAVVRIYKYTPSGSVYTNIVTWTVTALTIPVTPASTSLASTAGTTTAFATGDKLYIDYQCNITTNTGGAGKQIRQNRLSSDTVGKTGDPLVGFTSPGYSTTNQSTLSASGGGSALLLVAGWTSLGATLSATLTQSDAGGLAFNVVDSSNYYELFVGDASSPTANTLQLYKTVAGTRVSLGSSASISFTRGSSHTVQVITAQSAGTTTITVLFDGTTKITQTDSSSPFGSGQVGLRNDTVSGASSALYTAFSATSNDIATLVTSVPTHNYVAGNNFNFGSTTWATDGALAGLVVFPSNPTFGVGAHMSITFANSALGSALASNAVLSSYLVKGQTYCLSATFAATGLTNAQTLLLLGCTNAVGADVTGSPASQTGTNGTYRMSVQFVATSDAVSLYYEVGAKTTVGGTNAGTVTVTAVQCEPVWFASGKANTYNTTYPTPICDLLQPDCTFLPDNTVCRFDRIFTGYISHLTTSYEGTTRIWEVEAQALDTLLETSALVNASFANVTDLSMIQSIVNNLPGTPIFAVAPSFASATPQALSYRNTPVCVAGVTIASLQFSDATPREVLNTLADTTGFSYGVDAYFHVYYTPPFYNQAAYAFSSTPNNVTTFPYYDYSIEYDGTQLRNAVRVVGTTYQQSFVEAWHAQDGSHTETIAGGLTDIVVLFHFPVAVPSSVVIGGVTKTCILETNAGFGSAQSLCNTQWPYVSFLTGIAAGATISITYTYDALAYVAVQSPDSVAKYGRALYSKINDTNLGSNASAVTRGEAELAAYAQPRVTLKFKAQKLIGVGQVIVFTSALDGISNGHYTVQKVTATYLGNGINQYDIEAGTYVDDFIDFFRNTQKAVNRVDHDPAAPIQQINNLQQDSLSLSDSLNIHT
jgi:hypothetical protein